MNRILILLIGVLLISCNQNKKENLKVDESSAKLIKIEGNFDWLLGYWKRNNDENGKETFEIWEKKSNTEYSGIGFTMQNNDTIQLEKIDLKKLDNKWVLKVQLQGEPGPVTFIMTGYNEKEFVCENKEHDFPKLIKYWKNGNKLSALVSGDEMKISFDFDRIPEEQNVDYNGSN